MNEQERKWLDEAKQKWASDIHGHHNGLCGLARRYKRFGVSEQDAVEDMQSLYTSIEHCDSKKHDEHMCEVEQAVAKVYGTEYVCVPSKPKKKVVSYKDEQEAWRNLQNADTALKKAILASDVSETRIICRKTLKSWFKNATDEGRVSQGRSVEDKSWMYTTNNFSDLATGAKYVSLCTFGNAINDDEQKEADANGVGKTCFERTNDNVSQICAMLIEYDEPLVGEKISKDDFGYLDKAKKAEYRDRTLTDMCIIMERAGLTPTSVTFSGNRSYHFVFRLSEPVNTDDWNLVVDRLKSAYERIGADAKTLTVSRLTRMPCGCTRFDAEDGECQRVMYLDGTAETSLADYVTRLETVADEIHKQTDEEIEESTITIPMKLSKSKGGVTYKYDATKWEQFLKDVGVVEILDIKSGDLYLILTLENGVYREASPALVLDTIIKRIKSVDEEKAALFREERATKLKSSSLEHYMGMSRQIALPKDTRDTVYAPFKNGLLVITKDKVTLHDHDYCGYDIPWDTPTLRREYSDTYDQSEFETFINHACGSEEKSPTWQERKESIETLLGYLISRKKETVNWLNVLTEETMTENMGRTGKGLIMRSIKYWRKRYLKDCKTMPHNTDGARFIWSGLTRGTDYIQMDDLPQFFNIEKLFTLCTDAMEYEKKGKDAITLDFEDAPKFVLATNYFPRGEGSSYDGRLRIYELSNHYNATTTPLGEFGHALYDGWDAEEWARYDAYMARCVQSYLRNGLLKCPCTNVELKKLDNIPYEIKDWIENEVVDDSHLDVWRNKSLVVSEFGSWHYQTYKRFYTPSKGEKLNTAWIMKQIKKYCDTMGFELSDDNVNKTTHRIDHKPCKAFKVSSNGSPRPLVVVDSDDENLPTTPQNATTPDGDAVVDFLENVVEKEGGDTKSEEKSTFEDTPTNVENKQLTREVVGESDFSLYQKDLEEFKEKDKKSDIYKEDTKVTRLQDYDGEDGEFLPASMCYSGGGVAINLTIEAIHDGDDYRFVWHYRGGKPRPRPSLHGDGKLYYRDGNGAKVEVDEHGNSLEDHVTIVVDKEA